MSTLGRRTVLAAVGATVVAALPVFLLGGLSVQMQADLGFGSGALGAAISASFVASAVSSVPAGRYAERRGSRTAMRTGVLVAGLGLLGVAVAAASFGPLVAFLALAGVGNAVAQIGANLGLARAVAPARQGLAFGVKQAAVPIATLLSGLAVPALALTVGWRWAYALGALLAVPVWLATPPDATPPGGRAGARPRATLPPSSRRPLLVVAAGGVLAAGAANALGGFLVASAVAGGTPPATAGLLMSLGSVTGIAGRLVDGWLADRRDGGHLPVVALQLAVGALGLALLGVPAPAALVVGTLLGYGMGWSWPGLLNFAVVRLHREAPAAATSVTQTGIYVGAGGGPLLFGAVVEASSYDVAWLLAAAAMLAAGGLMLVARALFRRAA